MPIIASDSAVPEKTPCQPAREARLRDLLTNAVAHRSDVEDHHAAIHLLQLATHGFRQSPWIARRSDRDPNLAGALIERKEQIRIGGRVARQRTIFRLADHSDNRQPWRARSHSSRP
jgi:hypothetical protein